MSFQRTPGFQLGFQQLGSGVPQGPGVVLFSPDGLRFRSRADKALYAWAVFARDMRAPTAGYRPGVDHLVSAVALAAR
jgi:hypothetical protein